MGFDSLMQTVKLSLVCPVNQDWQFGPGPSLETSPVGFRGPPCFCCVVQSCSTRGYCLPWVNQALSCQLALV